MKDCVSQSFRFFCEKVRSFAFFEARKRKKEEENVFGEKVILCERGIRTYEKYTRNTLDLSAIPIVKSLSHLPVVVDPSHATGMNWLVEPLAMAAVACGADGLIIEVHNDPPHALCDGAQSLTPEEFDSVVKKVNQIKSAL